MTLWRGTIGPSFSKMTRSRAVENFKNGKLEVGLASFSETHKNELMWTHYSGITVGFVLSISMT
jgi:hypothetical protein